MPQFALGSSHLEYEVAQNHRIQILRPTIRAQIDGPTGPIHAYCMIDTGAPLSVISYSVGQSLSKNTAIRPVYVTHKLLPRFTSGTQNGTVPRQSLLEWEGTTCRLVELDVRLVNTTSSGQSGRLTLLAKWVQQPRNDFFSDKFILLGMHFLAANSGNLEVRTQPWGLSGSLIFP